MYYTKKFTLDKNSFDSKGNIYPYYVLDIFEKAAAEHGNLLGAGEEQMKEKNLFWVISGILYQVLGTVKPNEELIIRTWPLKPEKINFRREYVIYNSEGEKIIKGSANWLTIDRNTRRLVPGVDVFGEREFSDTVNFEGRIPRLRNFDGGKKIMDITPREEHIDSNGHVNNKHYTTFIYNALSGFSGVIAKFQIEYAAEIMPGDKVSVFTFIKDNETFIKGESEKLNFSSKISYL